MPLSAISAFVRGVAFKPADVAEDGIGVMRTKNVQTTLDLQDIIRIPAALIKRPDQYLQAGDTLVSSANSWAAVGKACWVPRLPEPLAIGGFVTALRPNPELVDPRYLFRWFTAPRTQALLRSFSNQTTNISNLNLRRAADMRVPLPPIQAQRRIAAILDQADALRTERRRSLGLLDDLARSLFDAEFGDACEATLRPLGQLAEVVSGLTKGRRLGDQVTHAVPYLAVANVQSGHLRLDTVKEIEATETEIERYRLQPGDLVMTEGGDPDKLGRGTLWQDELPLCLHQNHIFRVRLRSGSGVEPRYLAAYIAGQAARSYFLRSAKQTTGIASINMTQLRGLPVVVPSLQSQRRFIGYLEQAALTRKSLQDAAREADALFASLQSQAFSGELAHTTS